MAQSYFVKIRVVEARKIQLPLTTPSSSTLPNPYIEVEVGGDIQRTSIAEETSTCVWNATFVFSNLRLSPAQFDRLEARVRLRSANILVRDDVLGCITLELPGIYQQSDAKGHMSDTWVPFSDPGKPERVVAFVRLEAWVGLTGSIVETVSSASDAAALAAIDVNAALDPTGALSPVGVPQVLGGLGCGGGSRVSSCEDDSNAFLSSFPLNRSSNAASIRSLRQSSKQTACLPYLQSARLGRASTPTASSDTATTSSRRRV